LRRSSSAHFVVQHFAIGEISPPRGRREVLQSQRLPQDRKLLCQAIMERSTGSGTSNAVVSIHPLDPEDASPISFIRTAARAGKGVRWSSEARPQFDALMERVPPRDDVTFESGTVGDVPGLWVHPASSRSGEAILHAHGGWFNAGSANAYRHLVGHIAARAGTRAFVPEYRLAPEHPFPAAVDDVLAAYRGMEESGIRRLAVTGDSAGGNLALVLASSVTAGAVSSRATLVGVAALSPVTDLTLSGATYQTRADADPYFTKPQVAELVHSYYSYLGSADPNDPRASPLQGRLSGLPPVRIHVGDDEVLLDDSRRYVERAVAAGVDARLDVWMGMPHGFPAIIGMVKASAQALDAIGLFLTERLQA
jgi:monoterpene epsilon-lactone hydrolase